LGRFKNRFISDQQHWITESKRAILCKNCREGTYGEKEVIHAQGEAGTAVEVRSRDEQQGNFEGLYGPLSDLSDGHKASEF